NASGSATVTVRLHDDGGTSSGGADTSSPETFTINVSPVDQPPVVIISIQSAEAGKPIGQGPIARFSDAQSNETANEFSATIDFGDGSASGAGAISLAGSTYIVNADHTYVTAGTFSVTVTVVDPGGKSGQTIGSVKVSPAAVPLA